MIKQILKYKWYITIIMILIVVEPSINSILNFWLQRLFDAGVVGNSKLVILRLLTTGFLLWMLKRVVGFLTSVFKTRFICNARQDIKDSLFSNLLSLNTANVTESSSGEYISHFTNDITIIETRFYEQVISLVSSIISLIILGTSFFALNSKLAGFIILFGLVSAFLPLVFSSKLNSKNLEYSNSISQFTQNLKEYMVDYPTIKNYSIESLIAEKFKSSNKNVENVKFEADYMLALANNIGTLLAWFMQFIAVGLGLMLVVKGEIFVGTVLAAQAFASDLALPLQNAVFSVNAIVSVKKVVKKLEERAGIDKKEKVSKHPEIERDLSESKNTRNQCVGNLEFKDLELQISDKKIINKFSYTFEQGKKYLIVGLNGSGKSSLFKVLKKWHRSCSGNVLIDGRDISELKNDELSSMVSYLNENVSLFSGTVRENISLFRDYESEVFDKAISAAQVNLELERQIQDEGRNISSGEQRRIEIARSLVKSASILIFDEVVSTLDIETAYEIEKLALSFDDKTVIFISHNFSGKLIREYDGILVMDKGNLLASGTYEELLKNCEYFKRICDIKFG